MRRYTAPLLCAAALLAACEPAAEPPGIPSVRRVAEPQGFVTSEAPQASPVVANADVTPIITVGDRLPNGYVFAPIPDGLGAYSDGGDLVVYANHELAAGGVRDQDGRPQFPYARVSRLVIDRETLAVKDATSGIIDASAWLGAGAWLFDVQAHTLPVPSLGLPREGGQLLALRLPGS